MTTLLVASNGGHLKQLHRLRMQLSGVEQPFRWCTFDTPQARSLLADEDVEYVPYIGGRDPKNVLRNVPAANRIIRRHRPDALVSTGSAIALPFFGVARARRLPCHFIESAARLDGPSLTGRMMSYVWGVKRYTQYQSWADGRWHYRGSVFDAFASAPVTGANRIAPRRIVVTLGTYRGVQFRRLVERLLEILPQEAEVTWQTGFTTVDDLPIEGKAAIPERKLSEAMAAADVVVSHAGVGTALAAFEVGKCPVLVPRRAAFGEAVDDHQLQIAANLADRDLAIAVEAEELSFENLVEAGRTQVVTPERLPPFETL
jgi:UDP-N-acetylglucosamine--N-acetylmuramyl-(pentapeptide) pyrophosphoryl-undecaprenol N-acetylglucosamine transferase